MALCTRSSLNGRPAAPSQAVRAPRQLAVRALASADVSPDVAAARAWIASWRAKQGKPAPASERSAAPAAARAQSPLQASTAPDGTLVFTAEQLQSLDYEQLKKQLAKGS